MSSSHGGHADLPPASRRARTALAALLVPLVVATIVGVALLWPEHRKHPTPASLGAPVQLVDATVAATDRGPCAGDPSGNRCETVTLRITSGPDRGSPATILIQEGPGQPLVDVGDHLVVGRSVDASGGPATYYFSDFQRKAPMLWLGLGFALLVALVARWRGVGAIVGLGFTWLVVTEFVLPAVLEGRSPLLVAITGGAVIMFVVLYVAHGPNARTSTALVGTLLSLAATGGLAVLAVHLTHLTGLSSEEATYVQSYAGNVNLQGLLLGGIVIGSLGVLNDVTVTQASAVWEIHLAQPARNRRQLYASGMRVGRDHIASTVYTLVLAYTGAALPLLVLFTIANRSFGEVVVGDVVAEEVVRTLVGGAGLILAVPLTTALAAMVVRGEPAPTSGVDAAETTDEGDPGSVTDEVVEKSTELEGAAIEPEVPDEVGAHEEIVPRAEATTIEEAEEDAVEATGEDAPVEEVVDLTDHAAATSQDEPVETAAHVLETDVLGIDAGDEAQHPVDAQLARSGEPTRRTIFGRRKVIPSFAEARKMSRRERKFWEDD